VLTITRLLGGCVVSRRPKVVEYRPVSLEVLVYEALHLAWKVPSLDRAVQDQPL
jgi:hypothetical protein